MFKDEENYRNNFMARETRYGIRYTDSLTHDKDYLQSQFNSNQNFAYRGELFLNESTRLLHFIDGNGLAKTVQSDYVPDILSTLIAIASDLQNIELNSGLPEVNATLISIKNRIINLSTANKIYTLTQAGQTTSSILLDPNFVSKITVQYTVSSIGNSVVVRSEGSLDGVNWFNLDPDNVDTTLTENGTYAFSYDLKLKYYRLRLVSINGGSPVVNVIVVA